jgi:hypothetical protein
MLVDRLMSCSNAKLVIINSSLLCPSILYNDKSFITLALDIRTELFSVNHVHGSHSKARHLKVDSKDHRFEEK